MKENYLHLIWKTKRLPFHLLKTVDDQDIEIPNVGTYNTGSGPDFFNGQILLDGILHSGNIELHVKSSDWFLHEHQSDPAYSNVVLHVVYQHDSEIIVKGKKLPTIELKEFIDQTHFQQFNFEKINNKIVCAPLFDLADPYLIQSQLDVVLFDRFERKFNETKELITALKSPKHALFCMLLKGFGMKIHADHLSGFAAQFPFSIFNQLDAKKQKILLLGLAGFHESFDSCDLADFHFLIQKHTLVPTSKSFWKTKGTRPQGSVFNRLNQFLILFQNLCFDLDQSIHDWLIQFEKIFDSSELKFISTETRHCIFLNSIFLFVGGIESFFGRKEQLIDLIELLDDLSFEKNNITKKWKELGVYTKSAADSQACIELFNNYCIQKKCLNCKIGHRILKGID